MEKIFLDTNFFIDIVERKKEELLDYLEKQILFISVLSLHILIYVYKYKIPNGKLVKLGDYFNILPLTKEIAIKSLRGPTSDFEDNLQLHSAVTYECEKFLTKDKKLLKMGYFGKAKITDGSNA